MSAQCRAYGNLGLSFESQADFEEALNHQEQHLSLAAEMSDRVAKTLAYSSLGRIHHALGNYQQASQVGSVCRVENIQTDSSFVFRL